MSLIPGTAVATTSSAPGAGEPAGDPAQAPLLEVLEEGLVGGQGPGPDPGPDLEVLVVQGLAPEGGRQPRFAFDLDDQHARARTGGSGRQRRGDGGLPDAALARHDHDPGSGAELRELHRTHATGATVSAPSRPLARLAHWLATGSLARDARARAGRGRRRRSSTPPPVRLRPRRDPATRASTWSRSRACSTRRPRRSCSTRSTTPTGRGATMLVIRLDSKGAVDVDTSKIVRAIQRSKVPVVAWVGPSGAEAKGAATLVLEAAQVAFVAPGSDVGPADPVESRPSRRSRPGRGRRRSPRSPSPAAQRRRRPAG